MSERPCMIGIAGPSGAGKTLLANRLASALDAHPPLSLDAYYRDLSGMALEKRAVENFDHPDAVDQTLLIGQLGALSQGRRVEVPRYDFTTHTRRGTSSFEPGRFVVVEGLFALYWAAARNLFAHKVFIEAADAVCLRRRIERDVRDRGRTLDAIRRQYAGTVRPMYEHYIAPTRQYADLVVSGEQPADMAVRAVLNRLGR